MITRNEIKKLTPEAARDILVSGDYKVSLKRPLVERARRYIILDVSLRPDQHTILKSLSIRHGIRDIKIHVIAEDTGSGDIKPPLSIF